jgi:hypothetical protein
MPLRTIISMVHMPQSIMSLSSTSQRHANETGFSVKHFVRRLATVLKVHFLKVARCALWSMT